MSIPSSMPDFKYEYFIPLHPRVLKNSKQIVPIGGKGPGARVRHVPIPSKAANRFMVAAAKLFYAMRLPSRPIDVPMNLRMVFYGPWDATNVLPDMSNLYQALEDVMQRVRIIEDDTLVDNHDGSRRVRLCAFCPHRVLFKSGPRKGMLKPDCGAKGKCPYVGVGIRLTPADPEPARLLARERFAEATSVLF